MFNLDRIRPQPDDRLAFFQGFLRRPQQVGSVIPSSRFLERRIVALATAEAPKVVVELGPGTGGTTRALLRGMPEGSKLLAIEISPDFAALLQRIPDPRLIVHQGSAEHLAEALTQHGLNRPDVVVSGIPFSTMEPALGRRIVKAVHAALPVGGRFVVYQVRGRIHSLGRPVFGPAQVELELRNIPPMRTYTWRKTGSERPS